MVNTGMQKLLRVGELSKRTGTSTSAINYYVREGLLPPPLKTAPNMAYYDPGYVDMVNSIKVLQREKGLSLGEIKELLDRGEFRWTGGLAPSEFEAAGGVSSDTRRALDRRKHIMAVASKVFAERGYYATTISDIAVAAGIAKGTIYWYFSNKREIMLAILGDIYAEIQKTFGGILLSAPNGLEAVLLCVEPALRLLDKHGPIYLMYFLEIGSTDRSIQEKYRNIYKMVHAGTKNAIKRGIDEGIIRDVNPGLAAFAVMGLVERVSETSGISGEKMSVEEKAAQTVELVRHALAVKPTTKGISKSRGKATGVKAAAKKGSGAQAARAARPAKRV
jgi:AcrR family transcriptional regulator/predicted DNA-binding transcriptional regulator AlpA